MDRRALLTGLAAAPLLAAGPAFAWPTAKTSSAKAGDYFETVSRMARDLAHKPYTPPATALDGELSSLGYDAYRDINFKGDKAIWADLDLPFRLQMFHRGGPAPQRVDIAELVGGVATPIAYSADLFTFGAQTPPPSGDLGFSGFRIHTQINTPGVFDEFAVFQGASYFRAVAKGQPYGLSGRALGLNTGEAGPEEFPAFTAFWLERPAPGAASITVHALTDSPSVVGAHSFVITPGEATVMEVRVEVWPRVKLTTLGIAPMSSMYDFGDDGSVQRDDFRPGAHDSDGLSMATGQALNLWRPLSRPSRVRTSVFADQKPRGFGLLQRERDFEAYRDLETRYDLRPDCWVEPMSDWGQGAVRLLELPAKGEWEDNIAAWWRPAAPLAPRKAHRWAYRLSFGRHAPTAGLATILNTSVGAADAPGSRRYVVDFGPIVAASGAKLDVKVTASAGTVDAINLNPNPQTGGQRLAFRLSPGSAQVVELKAVISAGGKVVAETWLNQWTPPDAG